MPAGFNAIAYEDVHRRIISLKESHFDVWSELAASWNAVAYRFYACAEYNEAFIASVQQTFSPPPLARYAQERDLYGFFVNGLSTIESFCYALWAIASTLKPAVFLFNMPEHRRSISPETTADKFSSHNGYKEEPLAQTLQNLRTASEFVEWKEIRNILAHRSAPSRTFNEGGSNSGTASWFKGLAFDQNTTALRYEWLVTKLSDLLETLAVFVATHLQGKTS